MIPQRHYHGPLPDEMWPVLTQAHECGIAVQSNFARAYSPEVALAASLGWVSTVTPDGQAYSRMWRITVAGLSALHNKELMR